MKQHLYVDPNYSSRYHIDKHLTLIRLAKNDDTYFESHAVEMDGTLVAVMNVRKTSKRDQVKIKLNNEFIYTTSIEQELYCLWYIADTLDLTFSNYTDYEIAYDSPNDYLTKALHLYYQSNQCQRQIHDVHNSVPKYRVKGSRRRIHQMTDQKDVSKGTYTEGSVKSATQTKIYDKTYELGLSAKSYIKELHEEYFESNAGHIFRVEASAKSPAFSKNGILSDRDLVDLLMVENFHKHFSLMLGDKLVYRSLKPNGYDNNRNASYDEIKVLDLGATVECVRIRIDPVNQHKVHDKNVNRFKQLLNGYLDDHYSFGVVLKSVNAFLKGDEQNSYELIKGLELCKRRYENPIPPSKMSELLKLEKFLKGKMGFGHKLFYSARIFFCCG